MVRQLSEVEYSLFHHKLWFRILAYSLVKLVQQPKEQFIFSDDLYLGYVPNGQIEVIGIDPQEELFHTFPVSQKKKVNNSLLFQGHESA